MEHLDLLFKDFENIKVGIVGDVMLDTYMWGHVDRISPEAPVPIVSLKRESEKRIGGAGNVALNLKSLGAQAFVITITGDDDDAKILKQLFSQSGINDEYVVASPHRLTTNKIRVIARNQHMMRLDRERIDDLAWEDEQKLLDHFQKFIESERPGIVILEDYNKGVLTKKVIDKIISTCKENNILTAVDPKRKNFFEYRGVDIFKPNLKETKEALNFLFDDISGELLSNIHQRLHHQLNHKISLITLSEKGIFYKEQNDSAIIPSHIRNVADVSGAGDTVIAVAALVYAASKNVHLMAEVANIAGGLVCEEVGTAAIDKMKLLHECELLLS